MQFFMVTERFDSLENRAPRYDERVPLTSTDFAEAVEEARILYARLQRYEVLVWDRHPPVRQVFPRRLRVEVEVS